MTARRCRICGRDYSEGDQFCSQDGARLSGIGPEREVITLADIRNAQDARDARDDAELLPEQDALVGSTLDGRYRVLRVIGEGGMGVVYEAVHVLIDKHVAIKVLRDTFTGRADVVERFRQEAKSASKIGHPNIVDVSDFGETPAGQSYIVMEMLTGEDLADVLARLRVLSPARAVRIVYQVARALHATHRKNIVHRDLKPENIYLVERDGLEDFVKVVDFGVAKMSEFDVPPGRKLTRTGMLFGTPEYMSPEQALGKPFDHRVDIYALGAILFELLTGRVPFTGDNFMGILAQHGNAPVPSLRSVCDTLEVSPELEAVVMRALAKEPGDRYPSMGAFAEELRNVPEMPPLTAPSNVPTPTWSIAGAFGATPEALEVPESRPAASERAERSPSPPPSLPEPHAFPEVVRSRTQTPAYDRPTRLRPRLASEDYADAILVPPGFAPTRTAKLGMLAAVVATGVLIALVTQRLGRPHVNAIEAPAAALPPVQAVSPAVPETPALASAKPAETPTAPSEPTVARAEPDETKTVQVKVRTHPRGASVSAVGTEAFCSATPCALAVPRGRPVTLRAATEWASVERTLIFDDPAEVELVVSAARNKSGSLSKARTPSDLKIPSSFR